MNEDFQNYVSAIGQMFEPAEKAARDNKGSPPWSMMFNPDTAPTYALAWLGQFVGVELDIRSQFESDDDYWSRQRQRIKNHLGFARGSLDAIKAAAGLYLTGNKTVFIQERDSSAYHLTIITRTSETPDSDKVLREILKQKPAGIVLDYVVVAGRTFRETTATGNTFNDSAAEWPTFNDRKGIV
jgi:hypothetical protein